MIVKYSSVEYLDCHHSVGHISQFEPLKYRATLPAAFLFQIGPMVAYSPYLHSDSSRNARKPNCSFLSSFFGKSVDRKNRKSWIDFDQRKRRFESASVWTNSSRSDKRRSLAKSGFFDQISRFRF